MQMSKLTQILCPCDQVARDYYPRVSIWGGLVLVGILLVGCGGEGTTDSNDELLTEDPVPSDSAPGQVGNVGPTDLGPMDGVISAQGRDLAPRVSAADLQDRVKSNNAFAGDFYRAAAALPSSAGANMVFSPYSLVSALAMAYAGAAGDTATQMASLLRISQPNDTFHAGMNVLDIDLTSRDVNLNDAAMQVTNGLFLQRGSLLKTEFVDTLGINYGAPAYMIDTQTMAEAEEARAQINNWISDRTDGKIADLLSAGSTFQAKLVLTNAVLFKGAWAFPFDAQMTQASAFSLLSGATIDTPMMRKDISAQIASGPGFTAVSLPYAGEAFEMVLVLPDAGNFAAVEQSPALSTPGELLVGATERYVWLSLPRFKFKTKLLANELLAQLGMIDAFSSERADFSAINGERDILISQVIHDATIAVDEKGTEATAATAVVMTPSVPTESITFDRPFIFLIVDKATQSVLFMGRVLDPAE